jgi:L,D-peptidoglycan transpeptidase YkuD (ErfK/YbiS/YcfS/YnhG family)
MKHLLLPLLLCFSLNASEQIVLVVADDLNQSTAILQRFERIAERYQRKGALIKVNLGRNGLGWGLGENGLNYRQNEPEKYEGDGRSPAGIFRLQQIFGYAGHVQSTMPYRQMTENIICVDDPKSPYYNSIIPIDGSVNIRSFEWMRRDDPLYALGITVDHNRRQIPGRGSCIFLHVQKAPGSATSGCTSMTKEDLQTLIAWLNPKKKPLLVQIPREKCPRIAEIFRGVTCP